MRIGELALAAGVSRETIHFYLREGLLPPPEKINARVAYFDEGHLARLRLIRRLQQVHLPLSEIREHIHLVEGRPPAYINDRIIPRLVESLDLDGETRELRADEVAQQAGLTLDQVVRLEALGVLRPLGTGDQKFYNEADRNAASAVRTLLDQGVDLEALIFIRRYQELVEQENGFVYHHLILPAIAAGRRDQVSAGRGFEALLAIEDYLRLQFRRENGLVSSKAMDLPDPLQER